MASGGRRRVERRGDGSEREALLVRRRRNGSGAVEARSTARDRGEIEKATKRGQGIND